MDKYKKLTDYVLSSANCPKLTDKSRRENLTERQREFVTETLKLFPPDNVYSFPSSIIITGGLRTIPVATNLFVNIIRHNRLSYMVSVDEVDDDIQQGLSMFEGMWPMEFYKWVPVLCIHSFRFPTKKYRTNIEKIISDRSFRSRFTFIHSGYLDLEALGKGAMDASEGLAEIIANKYTGIGDL